MERYTTCQITPYFAEGERYPSLIGVRAEGDEFETAYISKAEHIERVSELEGIIRDLFATLEADTYAYDPEERAAMRGRLLKAGVFV